jgi:hypothetical protein
MAKKKGYNPKSRKNLNVIKKGEVRNPNGRTKGSKNRSTILEQLLKCRVVDAKGKLIKSPITGKSMRYDEAIDNALIKKALAGNIEAIREIKDTIFGKIKEVHEIIPPDITTKEIDEMSDAEAAAAYDAVTKK